MVWPNLPPCHRFLYFVLWFSTKTAWQRGSKHYQRFYEGKLRQTMVDSWYCLDQVSPMGRSQISRQSEVGKHKRRFVFRCCRMSILYTFWHYVYSKLFHSFEYWKIPAYNALWRWSLYSNTITRVAYNFLLYRFLLSQTSPHHFDCLTLPVKIYQTYMFCIFLLNSVFHNLYY